MRTPSPDPTHQGELNTAVSRPRARLVCFAFLALILSVPLAQLAEDIIHGRPPGPLALFERAPTRANLRAFERALEDASTPRGLVKSHLQLALLHAFDFADASVIVPRHARAPAAWLFNQLGNDYLSGPGFLDPEFLRKRARMLTEEEDDVRPDPRPAIIRFHADCAAAGVRLVFVPIPVKAMLQPAQLSGQFRLTADTPVPNNPSYPELIRDLRAAGVEVFDPTPPVLSPDDPPRYLRADTHWSPEWMQSVARDLAAHVLAGPSLPPLERPLRTSIEEVSIAQTGDTAAILGLPAWQSYFSPQPITSRIVIDRSTGLPIESREDADVVFIGDSFSNIYHGPEMGWGTSAGFSEHLAKELGRPIDALVRNGAAATELRLEFAARPAPLAGKRVVIWQVAMHEFIAGNWRIVPFKT